MRKDSGCGVTRGSGGRSDWRTFVRHAIDRLLAEQSIGAGIEIEGDQFTRFFVAGNIHKAVQEQDIHVRNSHERRQSAPQADLKVLERNCFRLNRLSL